MGNKKKKTGDKQAPDQSQRAASSASSSSAPSSSSGPLSPQPPPSSGPASPTPISAPMSPSPTCVSPPPSSTQHISTRSEISGTELLAQLTAGMSIQDQAASASVAQPATEMKPYEGVQRPGYGKDGKPVNLIANHFPVHLKSIRVFRYDIKVETISAKPKALPKTNKKPTATGEAGDEGTDPPKISNRMREMNVLIMEHIQAKYLTPKGITIAYDATVNAVTNKRLDQQSVTYQDIKIVDRDGIDFGDSFNVTLIFVKELDIGIIARLAASKTEFTNEQRAQSAECFQALEWITSYGSISARIPRGRSYYSREPQRGETHPLGGGLQLRFGIFSSLRPEESGLCLTIDRAANVFHEPMLVHELVRVLFGKRDYKTGRVLYDPLLNPLSEDQIRKLAHDVRTLKVELQYGDKGFKRAVRIMGVSKLTADKATFKVKDDKTGVERVVTVKDFFAETYKIRLQFPQTQCIEWGTAKRLVPMELCFILPNQIHNAKISPDQQATMVTLAANPPQDRFNLITSSVAKMIDESAGILTAFGVSVDNKPISVDGRVIEAPSLKYNRVFEIRTPGEWAPFDTRLGKDRCKFYVPADIGDKWTVLILNEENARDVMTQQWITEKFSVPLAAEAAKLGIRISPQPKAMPPLVLGRNANWYALIKQRFELIAKNIGKMKLVVAILPHGMGTTDMYNVIKYCGDVLTGMPTQCLKGQKIMCRPRPGGPRDIQWVGPNITYLINVLQKINAKGGGRNVTFIFDRKILEKAGKMQKMPLPQHFMVVGADVTHPAPGDELTLAVAAIVASMNVDCAKWLTKIRVQTNTKDNKATQEMIDRFGAVVVEMVQAYENNNGGKLPEAIVIYRDGVSEGQLQQVLDYEISSLRGELRAKWPARHFAITVIVTQKRHHTRLFLPAGRGVANPPTGTVVDRTICKGDDEFDYYIQSHIAIKGTARPTHYEVILDDNGLDVDFLQKLTYALCHIYTRCTRSISIPVPVAYADLAAFRGRNWIVGQQALEGRKFEDADIAKLNERLFGQVQVASEVLFYS